MTAALLVLAVIGLWLWLAAIRGARRWRRSTRELHGRLEAARVRVSPERVDFREIEGLPAPVQRYFRSALREGQAMVSAVRIRHEGRIDLGREHARWKPFRSEQRVVLRRPGFDWNARVRWGPGLELWVRDAFAEGEGILHATLRGCLSLAELRGPGAIAEGELMRFLAEAVWYPTALLPSQGVRWEAVDERSARAVLGEGSATAALTFGIGADGLVESVRAEARGRSVGGRIFPTPWVGRFRDAAQRGGMRVPLAGEVAWVLPDGERPYWSGRVVQIEHEAAP